MFKLGDKILPDAREASMKSLSSLLHPHKAPATPVPQVTPQKQQEAAPVAVAAFESMIADMSKLRVQLRKTCDELEAERATNAELRGKVDELQKREDRRAQLKASNKTEQALVEEVARMDALVNEERATTTALQSRVAQLEDELDESSHSQQTKIAELEAVVAELRDKLTSATMATSAVIKSSKDRDSAEIVYFAARQELDQAKLTLAQKTAAQAKEAETFRAQIDELKIVVVEKDKDVERLRKASQALERENKQLVEQLASTSSEFASTMQQAVEEVARLEETAKANESKLAFTQAQLMKAEAGRVAAQGSSAAERILQEQQRDHAVQAAKKLVGAKKISQREYENVVRAAEEAFRTFCA
jgi:chromosome segregation ATPase